MHLGTRIRYDLIVYLQIGDKPGHSQYLLGQYSVTNRKLGMEYGLYNYPVATKHQTSVVWRDHGSREMPPQPQAWGLKQIRIVDTPSQTVSGSLTWDRCSAHIAGGRPATPHGNGTWYASTGRQEPHREKARPLACPRYAGKSRC
jgi:hypothetical protein